jgi:glycosyltransferase involved in cell wall biosynthesis
VREPSQTIRILIQQPALPRYRVPVFRELAGRSGILLDLIYGDAPGAPANAAPSGFSARFVAIRRWGSMLWHSIGWSATLGHKYDVLVLTWDLHYLSLVPTLLLAKLSGVRTILWGHGYSKREKPIRAFARRTVAGLADAVLFYNRRAADEHIQRYGWKPERVFVALNAIDQEPIKGAIEAVSKDPAELDHFRLANDLTGKEIVLFVSRLMPENRIDLLLQAVQKLAPERPQLLAVIVGGGEDADRLKDLVRDLGVTQHVRFIGAIYEEKDLAPWFLSSKLLCYPANIGLSLLHAFGYGLPVITSDELSTQNPEIEALVHEYNGLYYKHNNLDSLVDGIRRLLTDDGPLERLSHNARMTVQTRFKLSAVVDGIEAAIRYCAGEPSGTAISERLRDGSSEAESDANATRVAIIANAHTPYRLHVHRRIVAEMPSVRLYSLYTHEASNAPWSFSPPRDIRPILFGRGETTEEQSSAKRAYHEWRKGGRVIRWLQRHAIEVVVLCGYNDFGRLRVLRWCRKNKIPVMLWGDSNSRGDNPVGLARILKKPVVSQIAQACDAILVCGDRGKEYFRHYGVTDDRMFYFPVEPDISQIKNLPVERIEQTRVKYGLDVNRRRIVFSGRLVQAKRCDLLIDAFASIAVHRPDWDLVIVGDGPLRSTLQNRLPAHLGSRVVWTGFFPHQLDVFSIYRLCDLLVLPSDHEPWALVLLEAAAADLAIVCTDVVGAAPEVVQEGANGYTFPPGDLQQLIQRLMRVTDPNRIDAYKKASTDVLERWRGKADLIRGLESALSYSCHQQR